VNAPPRVLSVCADDFGLTPAISRGIADLAQRRRLTDTSCLTNGAQWRESAPMLADLPPSLERGLHFNLTEGEPLSAELRRRWPRFPALPRLIVAAHLRRLPLPEIAREWQAQWQCFVDATGAAPRFVDGHQHVHHLPGVREIVVEAAADAQGGVAVRNTGCVIGPGDAIKRFAIERTGGAALQRLLLRKGIAHNAALTGVYGFGDADYRTRMQRWLAALPAAGALLLCHPAAADSRDAAAFDPIAAARLREAAYLGSVAFDEDLAAAGVTLASVWQQSPRKG
jgi:predicted glycoside hydrolase/deacetylase ChbG (UPF0249 family)